MLVTFPSRYHSLAIEFHANAWEKKTRLKKIQFFCFVNIGQIAISTWIRLFQVILVPSLINVAIIQWQFHRWQKNTFFLCSGVTEIFLCIYYRILLHFTRCGLQLSKCIMRYRTFNYRYITRFFVLIKI